jgi:hypothetical protein
MASTGTQGAHERFLIDGLMHDLPDRIDHLFAESDARMNAMLAVHAARMERVLSAAEREFRA